MEKQEKVEQYLEELSDENLLDLFIDVNANGGCFEFVYTYDLEELCSFTDTYDVARAIIYGDVNNVIDNVRYDAYGNLESVNEYELYDECRDNIKEIAEWLCDYAYEIRSDLDYDLIEILEEENDEEQESEEQ